jgi:hypothetical protein
MAARNFSPGRFGVDSTSRNLRSPLAKRVADGKHGFQPRVLQPVNADELLGQWESDRRPS